MVDVGDKNITQRIAEAEGEVIFDKNSPNNEPILSNFDGYFELEISENIKEIFIRYPKYKELKITIGDNNNLGKITLLKRWCKK